MAGWELYEKYVELHVELNNTIVDKWEELDQTERDVWNALAEQLI